MTFLGTAYTEAKLLAYAYAYEQASHEWRPPSVINPSLFRCAQPGKQPQDCAP
jgi:amidase